MINKIAKLSIFFILAFTFVPGIASSEVIESQVYKVGISVLEQVPPVFFGTWRVSSTLSSTDSPATFKKHNVDIWNLSKEGDVVNLSNPFSGASASITLTYAEANTIKFTKKDKYDGKILTDTVELNLNEDKFSGVNTLLLETLSDVDNSVIKSITATYTLKGEKIAGEAIIKENK